MCMFVYCLCYVMIVCVCVCIVLYAMVFMLVYFLVFLVRLCVFHGADLRAKRVHVRVSAFQSSVWRSGPSLV